MNLSQNASLARSGLFGFSSGGRHGFDGGKDSRDDAEPHGLVNPVEHPLTADSQYALAA